MGAKPIFDSDFFKNNRLKLREAFEGQAPIVLTANSHLQLAGSETLPFRQDSSFWYFTGIETAGAILVIEPGKEYIIVPELDPIVAMFDGDHDLEKIEKMSGVDLVYIGGDGWQRLEKRIKKSKHVATIQPSPSYIERFDMFTNPSRARLVSRLLETNSELDLIDLSPYIKRLRMVKADPEIEAIQIAINQTIKTFEKIDSKLSSLKSEHEVDALIRKRAIDNQHELSFDSLVAAGGNAATIHYRTNSASIQPGEPVLIDFGLKYSGYCADLTRTVSSNPSDRFIQVFEAVAATHNFALSLLKPGVNLQTYEQAVRQYQGEKMRELGLISTITEEAMTEFNPTRTSHFLGIDVHDVGDYDQPLLSGVVLTVEPGIYIPKEGLGVRLEDDVLITDEGHKVLSAQLLIRPDSLKI